MKIQKYFAKVKEKTKLATAGSALPVNSIVMAGKGACPSVNATAFANKKKPIFKL